MADIYVRVQGLDELDGRLQRLHLSLQPALAAAGRRLGEDAVKAWRSVVTVRTGRMRAALNFQLRRVQGGVDVALFVGRSGFYYGFQANRRRWTAHVERFVRANGAAYIRQEVNALIQRS